MRRCPVSEIGHRVIEVRDRLLASRSEPFLMRPSM